MARPKKQTVDYFPHFCVSGKTLFILEQEYQNDGYSLWFKLLEELGKSPGHYINYNDVQFQRFFAAKTHVSVTKTREILGLCSELDAIDQKLWENGLIWSQNFVNNIYEIAGFRRTEIPQKPHFSNKNTINNGLLQQKPPETDVIDDLTTQRKGKEIEKKENNIAEWEKTFKMIVTEMINVWKVHKPNYMSELEIDSHACLNIAYYIAEKKGWTKESVTNVREKEIINSWKKIIVFIVNGKDEFFKRLTLDGIANRKNLQKIVEAMSQANSTVKAAQTADDIIEQENRKLLEQASRKQ